MRSRLPRLAGIATAAALILSPLAASPANAAPGEGTLTVTIVDDLGNPVNGLLMLVDSDGDSEPVESPVGGSSTYTVSLPAGSYGIAVIGGWNGITCAGLSTCSFLSFTGGTGMVQRNPLVVTEGGTTPVTLTSATPTLVGSGRVGSILTPTTPPSLGEFGAIYGGYLGYSTAPTVTWVRDGIAIPGATEASYVPTAADVGKHVAAVLHYPSIVTYFMTSYFHADATPPPFTTSAVTVAKTDPTVALQVAKKFVQGKRPKAVIKVSTNGKPLAGLATLKIGKKPTKTVRIRAGFGEYKLPKLKPGKYKVVATFQGTDVYATTSVTKTITVKASKAKKHKK